LSPSRPRSPLWAAGSAALAVGAILLLEFGRVPEDTLWWRTAFDAGHALVFGVFAVGVLGLLRRYLDGDDARRRRAYGAAFVLATVAGVVTELGQVAATRDADPWDALRDVVGAAAFLLFAATLDGDLVRWPARPWIPVRGVVRVVAVTVLLFAFVPLAVVATSYGFRNAAFPHLLDFESYWESRFVRTHDASVTLGYLPDPWRDPNRIVGVVRFEPARWPSLDLREPYPDWRGFRALTLRVWSEQSERVKLAIRIDDAHSADTGAFADRFNRKLAVEPGENRFEIPLADLAAVRDGRFDLGDVRRLMLFLDGPDRAVQLYVDDLRLE
jgi:hypothetical protein